jgi:hypothetical protein
MGIVTIMHHVSIFGNSLWKILRNSEADNPFFTSDYPAAIEVADLNTPINRIVPLAPDLAIRIRLDIRLSGTKPDRSFARRSRFYDASDNLPLSIHRLRRYGQ